MIRQTLVVRRRPNQVPRAGTGAGRGGQGVGMGGMQLTFTISRTTLLVTFVSAHSLEVLIQTCVAWCFKAKYVC